MFSLILLFYAEYSSPKD